jgi:predicted Zn-dependent protease
MNRGNTEAAVDRIAALANDYDLNAQPASFEWATYMFQQSRRGPAGWQIAYAAMRDKILAGGDYAHVMALLNLSMQHPPDSSTVLARAAELAQGDADRLVTVAQLASSYGQGGLADSILAPMLKAHPTRAMHQLVAQIAIQQGRTGDALDHLEAAQVAGVDEAVNVSTMRGELAQILALARQLALSSTGPARMAAVARSESWAKKWRAVDPGNPQIDELMGELYLATGNKTEAWRQLSGVIERDPWSGAGYTVVADAYEKQGRVADALELWQQAIVIDQTNPTPRLRKAQALIALGRTADGDAILHDITGRKWHDLWQGVVYQATELLARGKR